MPILGHLLRVPDKGGVKQKNKHHETIFPLTENKEVQFKEPHLALGILKTRPWHGMDIFRNHPIKKTGQGKIKLQIKRHCFEQT